MNNEEQRIESRVIREATAEDIIKYKRGKQNVKPSQYYLCQCWCGKYWVPSKKNWNNKKSISCGSHNNEKRIINEIGNTYGLLTVVDKTIPISPFEHRAYWKCICKCGKEVICSGKDLREGKRVSCGCLRSKGQLKITSLLLQEHYNFKTEFKFSDLITQNNRCYQFDYAIFENDKLLCLIEYDGEQHFDRTNAWFRDDNSDQIKNQYCIDHNIKLVRIPYWNYNKIDVEYLRGKIYGAEWKENLFGG